MNPHKAWTANRDSWRKSGQLRDPAGAMAAFYTGYHACIMECLIMVTSMKRCDILAALRDASLGMADKLLLDSLAEGGQG